MHVGKWFFVYIQKINHNRTILSFFDLLCMAGFKPWLRVFFLLLFFLFCFVFVFCFLDGGGEAGGGVVFLSDH